MKKVLTSCVIVYLTLVCALNDELFVFPTSFSHSGVSVVMGNFKHLTNFGKYVKELLDHGNGKAV